MTYKKVMFHNSQFYDYWTFCFNKDQFLADIRKYVKRMMGYEVVLIPYFPPLSESTPDDLDYTPYLIELRP